MNVEKEIKIDFTEQEKEAIQTLIEMTEEFSNFCESCDCIECPLEPFCWATKDMNVKINLFKDKLTDYLNEKG